jgi:predicted HD phosphohydrolase
MSTRAEMALVLLDGLRGRDSGLVIDDYQHSLQTATRAERAGADADLVVAALLHDAGKAVTSRRHGRVAAEILAGCVRRDVSWVVAVHQDFTAIELENGRFRHARLLHALHPSYPLAKRFVDEWDIPSRDPAYDTLPVEHFAPLVHEVLGRPSTRRGGRPWRRLARAVRRRLPGGGPR